MMNSNQTAGNETKRYDGYQCLVVEDNVFAAEIMVLFLGKLGIRSDTAENGQTGLEMYLSDPDKYDMIFLDLQMPVMDGYEMAKHIRESNTAAAQTIPILAMSGTNTGDVAGRGGFTCFLKKPFELGCLPGVIDEVLKGR